MAKEFKFTWKLVKDDNTFATREDDKSFDKFLSNAPFIFVVTNKHTKETFSLLITKDRAPVFYREVFCKCGLNTMLNKVVTIINVFGYKSEKENTLFVEDNGKYVITDNVESVIQWQ